MRWSVANIAKSTAPMGLCGILCRLLYECIEKPGRVVDKRLGYSQFPPPHIFPNVNEDLWMTKDYKETRTFLKLSMHLGLEGTYIYVIDFMFVIT
jgi:hypothetical protein